MSLILNIETATSVCSVAISQGGKVIALEEADEKNVHAEKITGFIQRVLKRTSMTLKELDAVAVGSGPGSYTGLRIGTSAAKGLCYATGKPLIAISTLKAMAERVRQEKKYISQIDFYCPMIDARRLEVYTAIYDAGGNEITAPEAKILDSSSFSGYLTSHKVAFFGDGMPKLKELFNVSRSGSELQSNKNNNAFWLDNILASAGNMAALAEEAYQKCDFRDVAYYEPFYLKDFVGKKGV